MRKLGYCFVILGIVLLCTALFFLVYNKYEQDHAIAVATENLSTLKELMMKDHAAEETKPTFSEEDLEQMAGLKPIKKREMRPYPINGQNYIGFLTIPKENLELPVLMNIEPVQVLKLAPGLYYGGPDDDQMIIAGHYYEKFFHFLYDVEVGDEVWFTDWDGIVHKYRAAVVDIIATDGARELKNNPYALTLFTCTEDSAARYVVRYERADK